MYIGSELRLIDPYNVFGETELPKNVIIKVTSVSEQLVSIKVFQLKRFKCSHATRNMALIHRSLDAHLSYYKGSGVDEICITIPVTKYSGFTGKEMVYEYKTKTNYKSLKNYMLLHLEKDVILGRNLSM